ncbi:MAG: hypothetical protein IJW46_01885 [Clostridia bacterium]|nr:hypothetical protein [Clostridia bacterium]
MLWQLFQRRYSKELYQAFPKDCRNEVTRVLFHIRRRHTDPMEAYYCRQTLSWRLLSGECVTLPYRLKLKEMDLDGFSDTEKLIAHCLFSRSPDGYTRERHLRAMLTYDLPDWAAVYVMTLAGEYVKEILQVIDSALRERDWHLWRALARENFFVIKRLHEKMISYWNEFYRFDCYRYRDYVGKALFRDIFGYRKTGQKTIDE